jgi:hypothetical protein
MSVYTDPYTDEKVVEEPTGETFTAWVLINGTDTPVGTTKGLSADQAHWLAERWCFFAWDAASGPIHAEVYIRPENQRRAYPRMIRSYTPTPQAGPTPQLMDEPRQPTLAQFVAEIEEVTSYIS